MEKCSDRDAIKAKTTEIYLPVYACLSHNMLLFDASHTMQLCREGCFWCRGRASSSITPLAECPACTLFEIFNRNVYAIFCEEETPSHTPLCFLSTLASDHCGL